MKTKRSKYDTNPLDPDFVKNAEKAWGEGGEKVTIDALDAWCPPTFSPSALGRTLLAS